MKNDHKNENALQFNIAKCENLPYMGREHFTVYYNDFRSLRFATLYILRIFYFILLRTRESRNRVIRFTFYKIYNKFSVLKIRMWIECIFYWKCYKMKFSQFGSFSSILTTHCIGKLHCNEMKKKNDEVIPWNFCHQMSYLEFFCICCVSKAYHTIPQHDMST